MVKYLLTLVVACVVALPQVVGQTFEFRYQGQSLPDGATVTIAAEEDEWGFGEMCCYSNPSSDPDNGLILKVLSGSGVQGNATLTIDEKTFDVARLLWCMGGNCMSFGNNTTINKSFIDNNGICQVQFDAEDITTEGHLLATLTATIGSESHVVKIKFTNGEQTVVPGDVNGDGKVTSVDITSLYNWLLNSDDSSIVNGDQDGDGKITAVDVTVVYNIMLDD